MNYQNHVLTAAVPVRESQKIKLKDLLKKIEMDSMDSGMTKEDFNKWFTELTPPGSSFDPLNDDPASLMAEIKCVIHDMIRFDGPENDSFFDKALGAWHFYEKSIKLDLGGIYKRWINSPELFIPLHVQATNTIPLIELYDEAVRSFAFGNKVASMTLCRALMEHILKKYYGIQAEKLWKIIAIAEERFPNLQKLSMRSKKEKADDILHNYEKKSNTEDKAVIDFLKTIKYLVQQIPAKGK